MVTDSIMFALVCLASIVGVLLILKTFPAHPKTIPTHSRPSSHDADVERCNERYKKLPKAGAINYQCPICLQPASQFVRRLTFEDIPGACRHTYWDTASEVWTPYNHYVLRVQCPCGFLLGFERPHNEPEAGYVQL